MFNGFRWRRLLLNLHLYGGLFVCWYLVLFGYSSLAFNHPWLLPSADGTTASWEVEIAPDLQQLPDHQAMDRIRESLDLIGWFLPWTLEKPQPDSLDFELSRPGKKYQIFYNGQTGSAQVESQSTGVGPIVKSLHGLAERIPGSRLTWIWGLYTELTTWFVFFAVFSGSVLWATRTRRRRNGTILGVAALLLSLTVMYLLFSS
jgi:hypothetical protein